jgi:uracil-DNA glycosylase family 4
MTKTDELKHELQKRGLRYVGTRGNVNAPIWLVGEAPGVDEEQQGVPFCGASGRMLDHLLREANVDLSRCFWTNAYKTRPPENKIDRISELGIPLTLYQEQLIEELHATKPTFICALGATPLGVLCPQTIHSRTKHAAIGSYQGSLLISPRLPWPHYVVGSYHPAYVFKSPDVRQLIVLCLAKLAEEHQYWRAHNYQIQPLPQRRLISDPSADDAIDFLRVILAQPKERLVSVDIENIGVYSGKYKTPQRGRVPYVIGFSVEPTLGMSIGLGEYDIVKAVQIWSLINDVLRTSRQVYQNGQTHDIPWLHFIGFDVNAQLSDDTLVMHHTLWPELSHKLEFLCFQYTREPFYKEEGRNWTVKERQKLKAYNCKDVCVTLEIYNAMRRELDARS